MELVIFIVLITTRCCILVSEAFQMKRNPALINLQIYHISSEKCFCLNNSVLFYQNILLLIICFSKLAWQRFYLKLMEFYSFHISTDPLISLKTLLCQEFWYIKYTYFYKLGNVLWSTCKQFYLKVLVINNIYTGDSYYKEKEKCKHLADDWFICRLTLPAVLHRSPPQPS